VPPETGSCQPGRFIGHQAIAGLTRQATPDLAVARQSVHFTKGPALRRTGGRDVDFIIAAACLSF
jgi:hypothetical protein